jgi:hypothetical protein
MKAHMETIHKLKERWFEEGKEAAKTLKSSNDIERICQLRKNALTKEIQPQLLRLNVEGSTLVEEERTLAASLSNSPTPIACGIGLSQGIIRVSLSLLLVFGTWAIWWWSLSPFKPDKIGLLVLSLTVASVLIGDLLLRRIGELFPERQRKIFSVFLLITAFILFLVAEANFGIVRGALSRTSLELKNYASVVDNAESTNITSSVRDFYKKGFSILNIVMPLLAVSLSIGSAVAFHEGSEKVIASGGTLLGYTRLGTIRRRIIAKGVEIKELEAIPDVFESEFMRGTFKTEESPDENKRLWMAIITFAVILIAILIFISVAFGADSVIVAIDLTGSQRGTDYKGDEEFHKNVKAVEGIINKLKAGSKFRVIGITEDSFKRPYIIMNKKLAAEAGYFEEILLEGKQILLKEWKELSKGLKSDAQRSDIFGAISLASHLFQNDRNMSKLLIIFSDMRQRDRRFNFEKLPSIDLNLLQQAEKEGLISGLNLTGVKVYVLGVHTIGKDQKYWESLKKYWEQYFKKANADLRAFTMERGINYE